MSEELFAGFTGRRVPSERGTVFARVGGSGPAVLLLHGYPQTHLMWHGVAPALADRCTVVAADLPGYGRSGQYVIPAAAHDIVARWCMQWGGDWDYPDPMHVEIHCTPEQIAAWAATTQP